MKHSTVVLKTGRVAYLRRQRSIRNGHRLPLFDRTGGHHSHLSSVERRKSVGGARVVKHRRRQIDSNSHFCVGQRSHVPPDRGIRAAEGRHGKGVRADLRVWFSVLDQYKFAVNNGIDTRPTRRGGNKNNTNNNDMLRRKTAVVSVVFLFSRRDDGNKARGKRRTVPKWNEFRGPPRVGNRHLTALKDLNHVGIFVSQHTYVASR